MNGLERIRKVLNAEEPDRTPVFPLVHYGTARAAGYKIRDFSTVPEINARCLIHAYRQCGYDGVQPSVAVMVEGEAIGGRVEYPEDNVPFVKEVFLKSPDVGLLTMPEPQKTRPMSLVIESTRRCAAEIGQEAFIAPSIMGPLNSAGQMRGVETLMFDFFDRPDFVVELLEFTTALGIEYGKALLEAGAHGVFIGEAMCSPAFISPTFYRRFVVAQQKRLIDALMGHGAECTILHICADTKPIMKDYAVETGTMVIDLDWQVDVAETLNSDAMRCEKTLVRGNLDPAGDLLRGTPRDVLDAARRLIESVGKNPRFILGSGCAMNPDSLPANCIAMVEAAERYGRF
jgi:uroporphyrinogen decarboxylase